MINSLNTEAAKGYRQAAISVQKLDGETFIQTDVCPKAGDAILDLGCGTGELSAYLAELVGAEGKVVGVDPDIACVASVSVRFRRKERGTRVKDREKSGSRFISRAVKTESLLPRYFFAPKPNGNACYAG